MCGIINEKREERKDRETGERIDAAKDRDLDYIV